jgi:hypothetical protein
MLAVVEQYQHVLGTEGIEQGFQDGPTRLRSNPQGRADGRRHRVLV